MMRYHYQKSGVSLPINETEKSGVSPPISETEKRLGDINRPFFQLKEVVMKFYYIKDD